MKLPLTKDERAALMMAAAAGELDTARIPRIEKELNNAPPPAPLSPYVVAMSEKYSNVVILTEEEAALYGVPLTCYSTESPSSPIYGGKPAAKGKPEPAACAKSKGKSR